MQLRPDALVFGSGDIWNVHDIFRMLSYTGVKAVSVARGSIGNPWIFRQARDMMAGRPPAPPTIAEQRAVLLHHFELSVAINGETRASKMMRKFGLRFAQHHPDGEQVRLAFINVNSIDQWRAVLDRYYNTDDASVRTETTAVRTIPVDPAESQHFQAASIT